LLITGLTISAALLARSLRFRIVEAGIFNRHVRTANVLIPFTLALSLAFPLYDSKISKLLRSEQASFHTFWLESMQRHTRLMLPSGPDLILARLIALPTTLVSSDLGDDPHRLPNDCVARFYGKNTVALAPNTKPP
jgi:hypothetical protein